MERAVDGRYLVNEFHCSPDVWAQVVSMLASRADIVLIDLGGWNASHSGATFELSLVVDQVPLSRIVWLADRQTDEAGTDDSDRTEWTRLPDESVNARLPEPCIEVMRCSGQRRTDAAAISIACSMSRRVRRHQTRCWQYPVDSSPGADTESGVPHGLGIGKSAGGRPRMTPVMSHWSAVPFTPLVRSS